jgi:hypothetical protein
MGNYLKGGLVGGLILFMFQSVSWMALPWHSLALKGFPNESAVRQAVSDVTQRGMYMVPNPAMNQGSGQVAPGPMVFAAVVPSGVPGMGLPLAIQLANQILLALLATHILLQTKGLSYGMKVRILSVIGVLIGLGGHIPTWAWWGFSGIYTAGEIVDAVIGWTLAGLAMGKLVKTG